MLSSVGKVKAFAAFLLTALVRGPPTNPRPLVLAVGAGSLLLSHANDAGFWLSKEYFSLSVKDPLRS